MKIWKMHALGNNFVFVTHDEDADYINLAEILCRQDISIGADGLLSVNFASSPPMVRMWNPDGTADFCGNGLCCAAFLFRHVTGQSTEVLGTPGVAVPVSINDVRNGSAGVTIRIPYPDFDPQTIPLDVTHGIRTDMGWQIEAAGRTFEIVAANNGNMHTVIFVDNLPSEEDFVRYSPAIETHPLFPFKTNVLWCRIEEGRIRMRIWERSVGETFSCGTGSAAAATIAVKCGFQLPEKIELLMPGGSAYVSISKEGVELTTRATLVFEGMLID